MSNMSIIIPYRKKATGIQYLIKREFIVGWDQNPDICGISATVPDAQLESALSEILEKDLNIHAVSDDFMRLGVCALKRNSEHMCYLYAFNINSKLDVFDKSKGDYHWVDDEELLESIDPYLLAAYARLKFLIL